MFTLFQGGSSLQTMDTSGNLTTLTLPTGVTVDSTKTPRMTVYGRYVVVVNSVSRPVIVDAENVVRVLCPLPPKTVPALSGAAGGALTGTFHVQQTFKVWDSYFRLISESDYGPPSLAGTISAQYLQVDNLDISTDDISGSGLYRTTTGGSVYFPWLNAEGNTATSVLDDLSDASLSLAAAPTLGACPEDLELINEFKERLWGKSSTNPDYLRYTEATKMYAWPITNTLLIPRLGGDMRGITGTIPRREALIVGRQDRLFQITGDSNTNFRVIKLKEGLGIESADSIVVHQDSAFWLSDQGICQMTEGGGIEVVSDSKVSSWFCTDTYFNRDRFQYAVGRVDTIRGKYQLLLSAVGSTALDRWIEYDIKNKTFWGPHKTDDFTPTWITTLLDSSGHDIVAHASSSGFWYQEQATRTDGTSTGIAFDVEGKFHDDGTPDVEKQFLQLSLLSKAQAAGTLDINPYLGTLEAALGTTISADMTKSRQKLRNIGLGKFCKLNFKHSTVGQDVEIYGYEIPFFEVGRR